MKKWKFGGRTRFLDLQLESHLEVEKPATLFQFFTCQSWRSWLRVNWQMPKILGNTSESSNMKMENLPFTNNFPSYKPPLIRRLLEEWLMCTHPPQRFSWFLGFVSTRLTKTWRRGGATLWWTNILLWKITIFNGKIHYKWWFSMAMLVHQRVNASENPTMVDLNEDS